MAEGKVYFIGGGPGDPELLTLKAKRLIEAADVVIYADSLVHPSIVEFARDGAEVYGSKDMDLDQIMQVTLTAAAAGKTVARIQSGDPSVYGAMLEQMRVLEGAGVDYEIIPGVSAAFAAAAKLKAELTVPDVTQTIIMTRAQGRIAMPPKEQLRDLAAHGCSLIIFLGITRVPRIVRDLEAAGYTKDTPVAIAYRVGWEDEQFIRGTLADIAAKVRDAKITRQALIFVGKAVDPALRDPALVSDEAFATSHLYSGEYTHLFRRSRNRSGGASAENIEAGASAGVEN